LGRNGTYYLEILNADSMGGTAMRRIAAAALLALFAAAAPAAAKGSRPLIIGDPAGDANSINDGGEHGTGNVSTPTSEPSLDLRRIEVAPLTRAGSTAGFTVAITTEGALKDGVAFGVRARTENCPDIVLRYVHDPADPSASLSSGCATNWQPLQVQRTPLEVRVEPRKATIIVPFTSLPERAREDDVLKRIVLSSSLHATDVPTWPGRVGTSMADTTLGHPSYTMRQ
jgi:hypothetical protein